MLLSAREKQIALARGHGQPIKAIAGDLGIAESTVKTHLGRIFAKLGVQCSLELLHLMQPQDCAACPYLHPAKQTRLALVAAV
jgi:DNA-binding NarL/FixJ family response regulator